MRATARETTTAAARARRREQRKHPLKLSRALQRRKARISGRQRIAAFSMVIGGGKPARAVTSEKARYGRRASRPS